MLNQKKQNRGSKRASKSNRATIGPAPSAEYGAKTAENFAALRLVRAPRGPNNKYIVSAYNALSGAPTPGAPVVTALNVVAPGTAENQRIGRLCKMLWLDLDLELYSGTISDTSAMRVYVIAEVTALGAAVSAAQFFQDAAAWTPTSQRDRTNRNASRFVVLYDSGPRIIGGLSVASGQAAPVVTGAGQPANIVISRHIPLGFSTDYSRASGGTVADIDTNSVCLLVVSDQTTASQANFVGGYTLCFNDDS